MDNYIFPHWKRQSLSETCPRRTQSTDTKPIHRCNLHLITLIAPQRTLRKKNTLVHMAMSHHWYEQSLKSRTRCCIWNTQMLRPLRVLHLVGGGSEDDEVLESNHTPHIRSKESHHDQMSSSSIVRTLIFQWGVFIWLSWSRRRKAHLGTIGNLWKPRPMSPQQTRWQPTYHSTREQHSNKKPNWCQDLWWCTFVVQLVFFVHWHLVDPAADAKTGSNNETSCNCSCIYT
jgi:hypothetical protein